MSPRYKVSIPIGFFLVISFKLINWFNPSIDKWDLLFTICNAFLNKNKSAAFWVNRGYFSKKLIKFVKSLIEVIESKKNLEIIIGLGLFLYLYSLYLDLIYRYLLITNNKAKKFNLRLVENIF